MQKTFVSFKCIGMQMKGASDIIFWRKEWMLLMIEQFFNLKIVQGTNISPFKCNQFEEKNLFC